MALGFRKDDVVQYELRVGKSSKLDLIRVLQAQRELFAPLTSGGHPRAAGALVTARDIGRFESSLRQAVEIESQA